MGNKQGRISKSHTKLDIYITLKSLQYLPNKRLSKFTSIRNSQIARTIHRKFKVSNEDIVLYAFIGGFYSVNDYFNEELIKAKVHAGSEIYSMCVVNNSLFASGSSKITIWDKYNFSRLRDIELPGEDICLISYLHALKESLLVSCDSKGRIHLWGVYLDKPLLKDYSTEFKFLSNLFVMEQTIVVFDFMSITYIGINSRQIKERPKNSPISSVVKIDASRLAYIDHSFEIFIVEVDYALGDSTLRTINAKAKGKSVELAGYYNRMLVCMLTEEGEQEPIIVRMIDVNSSKALYNIRLDNVRCINYLCELDEDTFIMVFNNENTVLFWDYKRDTYLENRQLGTITSMLVLK